MSLNHYTSLLQVQLFRIAAAYRILYAFHCTIVAWDDMFLITLAIQVVCSTVNIVQYYKLSTDFYKLTFLFRFSLIALLLRIIESSNTAQIVRFEISSNIEFRKWNLIANNKKKLNCKKQLIGRKV